MANLKIKALQMLTKVKLTGVKYSPEILVAVGISTGIAAGVSACFATRKIDSIIDNHKTEVKKCHDAFEGVLETTEEYLEKDFKRDIAITYANTALQVTKLYLPSVALGTISIMSVLGSHRILRKRNLQLAAAYATTNKAFKEYRKRVVEELGQEMDTHFRLGTKLSKIENKIVDEKGKEKTVKEEVVTSDYDGDGFVYFFDVTTTPAAEQTNDYNKVFLSGQRSWLNNRLHSQGFVYLNEVLEALGFDRSAEGQVAGWVDDSENGDGYIDFRETYITRTVDGKPVQSVMLDFNVDGDILSLMY